jgi:broad specificity phosphatase PhoE
MREKYLEINMTHQIHLKKPIVTITLIRHGESETNADLEDKIGGRSNHVKLTERGEAQARALGDYFKRKGVQFTAAYSSTAARTQRTAEICFAEMGNKLPILLDDQLLERSAGDWEGKFRKDTYGREKVQLALKADTWNFIPGDDILGESHKMAAERMKHWVETKMAQCKATSEKQHIVVFTHSLAIKMLLAEILDLDRSTAHSDNVNPINNTSVTQLCYEGGRLLPIVIRNDTTHLQEK